jgi:hypothetical protein|tara:strand:+ start:1328 stop:2272 length:945 start_codon:yes stop_codon:yes gene_type:complete
MQVPSSFAKSSSIFVLTALASCILITACSSDSNETVSEPASTSSQEQQDNSGNEEQEAAPAANEQQESSDSEEQGDSPATDEQQEESEDASSPSSEDSPSAEEPSEEPFAPSEGAIRVQFAPEDIGTVINGGVLRGESPAQYILQAAAGQLMTVSLQSLEDNGEFTIYGPTGQQVTSSLTNAEILLPLDGDYIVEASPTRGNLSFTLSILITNAASYEEVRFNPGTFGVTIEGGVLRGETGPVYGLVAAEGQTIDITLTSLEENGIFNLAAPDGKVLVNESTTFTTELPATGLYLISTGGIRGNVSFTLEIAIR